MASKLHPMRRPNLLCIGGAKTGTTWLSSVLAFHPDIFVPPQKELNALHYLDFEQRIAEYEAYFRRVRSQRIRCDFSVRYLASPNAPRAAACHTPDAKILLSLRNPVDQVQSHYWHLLRQNFHQAGPLRSQPTLFEALERFPDLLLEPALYGKHIQRWLAYFPRQRMFMIRHENLKQRRDGILADLCEFLEIDPFDFQAAAARVSFSDSRGGVQPRRNVLGTLYPAIYSASTRGPLRCIKSVLGVRRTDSIKRALKLRQISEAVFFEPGYEVLGSDGRARLSEIFRSDVEQLSDLTQLDFSSWMDAA